MPVTILQSIGVRAYRRDSSSSCTQGIWQALRLHQAPAAFQSKGRNRKSRLEATVMAAGVCRDELARADARSCISASKWLPGRAYVR